ncbi:MAG: tRNA (guanine(46)-N(7))-methyltransferase TrmB [Alphaproteobacteria bacterium]|nr:tRNA (guanine(46)-N(7))-methyltransferase TrmB [Alphaproteobacteria bacterium]
MENTGKSSVIRTFGRIRGKKLSTRQQWLVDNLLPELAPEQAPGTNANTILEIGFGAGEHLLHLARENPDSLIIGAEPFINGVASLLSQMADEKNEVKPEYKNIRILPDDARKLLTANIRPFNKIYILHPDPWPKARHEKRRLLSTEFLNLLAGYLAPNGQIIIGTDHGDLFNWILEQDSKTRLKTTTYDSPPEAGLDTRYKAKDMFGAGHTRYLVLTLP